MVIVEKKKMTTMKTTMKMTTMTETGQSVWRRMGRVTISGTV